jgi:hypothetical protein
LRRVDAGIAHITDSSQNGPNGIIVVDVSSGKSWRKLDDHPSTRPESLETFLSIVEGRLFVIPQRDGSIKLATSMSADGIAISSDGSSLYYCPLASRKLYSIDTEMLIDESADKDKVASAVTDEGDKGGRLMGLNLTPMNVFIRPTTSTMQFCEGVLTDGGRRWCMILDYYGLIFISDLLGIGASVKRTLALFKEIELLK